MQDLASSRNSARSSTNLSESVPFSHYNWDVFSLHAVSIWHVVLYIQPHSRLSTNFSASKFQRAPQVLHVPQHSCSRVSSMSRNEKAELRNVTPKKTWTLSGNRMGCHGLHFGKQELAKPLRSSDQSPPCLSSLSVVSRAIKWRLMLS